MTALSTRVRTPWALWVFTMTGLLVTLFLALGADAEAEAPTDGVIAVAIAVFVVSYATVGALVASRLPRSPIGWLAGLTGLLYALAGSFLLYSEESALGRAEPPPGAEILFQLSGWMWMAAIVAGGPLLLLYFPNGRLPSGRWRIVVAGLLVGLGALVLETTFRPGPPEQDVIWTNPFGITGAGELLATVAAIGGLLMAAGSVLALISVFVRYRKAPSQQRQQLRWFFFALGLAAFLALPVSISFEALGLYELSNLVVTVALSLIPISIGAAILRHRVLDIDVVINKALVYSLLTAVLAAVYLGVVVSLQRVLEPVTADSDIAVAGSTLAVAALFRPLLGRMQSFIDRRFYRRKYDATETLGAFSARLRDQVDLDSLSREVTAVVAATMQPAHVSLWLRFRSEAR